MSEKSVLEKSCREVLETSRRDVLEKEKCCSKVLKKSVVEEFFGEERQGSLVEKLWEKCWTGCCMS